ncbi:MAG TPA: class I SAM-dependent methyltransferase [Pyrinomonadaceae bacterium]|nr:class I SAM-dependent methyltransferase [Pyrinomonadaceae bacterium]
MTINWWENFFHGVALDFWRAAVTAEHTRAEADFIAKQLQLSNAAKVLDIPCGNGRLAIELAKRGLVLTGVDIATEFMDEARNSSTAAEVKVDWQTRDMRDLPWSGKFDGAFCFGNSFGYLDDEANADFLKSVAQTLKPGSRFILDAPAAAECVLPNFQASRSIEIAGIKVVIQHRYDHEQGRMFNDFTFTRDGVVDQRPSSQRTYTYRELTELLRAAGLETIAAYASLTEEPFQLGAQKLLLVAAKL